MYPAASFANSFPAEPNPSFTPALIKLPPSPTRGTILNKQSPLSSPDNSLPVIKSCPTKHSITPFASPTIGIKSNTKDTFFFQPTS